VAWCENQVAAAIKLVPLGQAAGQRILSALIEQLPAVAERGLALADNEIGALAPRSRSAVRGMKPSTAVVPFLKLNAKQQSSRRRR